MRVLVDDTPLSIDAFNVNHQNAFNTIAERIFNEEFNYSPGEKIFYALMAIASGYFSVESSKFYFTLGGSGTKYLPIGSFSEDFGGEAAFWCNATLNWYFMISTILAARNSYYYYQFAKELKIAPPAKELAGKLIIAFMLSATAGVVFSLIAGSADTNIYNQIVTGAVNFLLSYIGSLALELFLAFGFLYGIQKIFQWCRHRRSNTENIHSKSETAQRFDNNLEAATDTLKALPNDAVPVNFPEYSKHIQNLNLSTITPLLPGTLRSKASSWISHLFMQTCDKIAIYGYYLNTVYSSSKLFTERWQWEGGTAIFLAFAALSAKVVYETTRDLMSLSVAAVTNIQEFIRHPNWSSETFTKLAFIYLPAIALALVGYYIAYISSNTSLELNAQYGWNDWWNVYPTCLGATVFNGFGFLQIILPLTSALIGYKFYSAQKRNVLYKHGQICSFFQAYPDALDTLANKAADSNYLGDPESINLGIQYGLGPVLGEHR